MTVREEGCQTNLLATDVSLLHTECARLKVEIAEKSMKLADLQKSKFTESFFETDDKKVTFLTGLPSYRILMVIFKYLCRRMTLHHRSTLTLFQQYILVLMKLRLSLPDQLLAYLFHIHQSTANRIFERWIDPMFILLKGLLIRPERENLLKTMPREFRKHFPKCVCVIDCFEIFSDRSKDLEARNDTYSHYKSHNTVKYLIAIVPQGSISFISRGWGGRASDKTITENCGILNKLVPGDQVLADRGFTVKDSVGMYCAELVIPPFTKGKSQINQVEVDTARVISRVRIHVERVIGMLRQK